MGAHKFAFAYLRNKIEKQNIEVILT
jgi:hypothetical protein